MTKKIPVRILALILVFLMVVSSFPTGVYADELLDPVMTEDAEESVLDGTATPEAAEETLLLEENAPEEETAPEVINDNEDEMVTDEAAEPAGEAVLDNNEEIDDLPVFEFEPVDIDGVRISAYAPKGVFPEGAFLSVRKASETVQADTDAAIEKIRAKDTNVAVSYTYDIKILDKDGRTELEPEDKEKVKVSFTAFEASDQNLETKVYHISEDETTGELSAEELPVLTETEENEGFSGDTGKTIVVETDGFSYFTVEFTYNDLKYVLDGNSSIPLTVILNAVGLTGEVSEVEVSNSELFTASKEDGVWSVTALYAFDTEEWMKVTITGVEYLIKVTDDRLVTTWADIQAAIDNGTEEMIILGGDIKADGDSGPINVQRKVTIDLNGHILNRNLTKRKDNGHVIEVRAGELTIKDSTGSGKGKITGGNAKIGGGIFIDTGAHLVLESGVIERNTASADGGGIYVKGKLTTGGGRIINNSAGENGGGIYVDDNGSSDNDGIISLNDTAIALNRANEGGGLNVHLKDNSSSITNCEITQNRSDGDGGGIRMYAKDRTLSITDTVIDKNESSGGEGGGICIFYGTIDIKGSTDDCTKCSVNNNISKKDGGGISVTNKTSLIAQNVSISNNLSNSGKGGGICNTGSTALTNCSLEKNQVHEDDGGGIYSDGILSVNGGIITKNEADGDRKGDGIYISRSTSVSVGGALVVAGNGTQISKQDIYLPEGKTLKITSGLKGSNIGVTLGGSGLGIFTTGYAEHNPDKDPIQYFYSPEGFEVSKDAASNEAVIGSSWRTLQEYLNNGMDIVLEHDYTAGPDEEALSVPGTYDGTIDLNGFTLNRNLKKAKKDGQVIILEENAGLTIRDGSTGGTGTITGGNAAISMKIFIPNFFGGGICVKKNASLTIEGGNISGNYCEGNGGGIYVDENASLTIMGGSISNNYANGVGGGIYVGKGDLSMTGGSVEGNQTPNDGGGIYVENGRVTGIKNAVINENNARGKGGGLYLKTKENSSISGCQIMDNTSKGDGGGLYMDAKGSTLTVEDTRIDNNSVISNSGGGICLYYGTINMKAGSCSGNSSRKDGGGVQVTHGTVFNASTVSIENNKAGYVDNVAVNVSDGGGIWNKGTAVISDSCTIGQNRATGDGGGIYSENRLELIDISVTSNSVAKRGGGIFIDERAEYTKIAGVDAESNTAVQGKDLFLEKGKKLTLESGKNITQIANMDMEELGVFTEGFIRVYPYYQPNMIFNRPNPFHAPDQIADFSEDRQEARLRSNWNKLQAQLNEGGTVKLDKDYTACSTDGPLKVEKDVTIDLNGFTLNRNLLKSEDEGNVIRVSDAILTITDSSEGKKGRITGGNALAGGGILVADSGVNRAGIILNGGTITGNFAVNGGGIYVFDHCSLTLNAGKITGNFASDMGGGVYSDGMIGSAAGSVGCTIDGNTAVNGGGGIYVWRNGGINLNNAKVSGNSTQNGGGGIDLLIKKTSRNRISINTCTITNNRTSKDYGGGIKADLEDKGTTLTLKDTDIEFNSAQEGGGIYLRSGSVIISNTDTGKGRINSNIAYEGGGGIKLKDSDAVLTAKNVNICNNHAASEEGGGIKNYGTVTITDSIITGNASKKDGGGIYSSKKGDLTLDNSEIRDNLSEGNGGGVYNGNRLTVRDSRVHANTSYVKGGGIYIGSKSDHTGISGSLTLYDNTAHVFGDDVFMSSGKKLTLAGPLTGDGKIGISLENGTGKFTKDYSKYQTTDPEPQKHFNARGFDLVLKDGEVEITSGWAKMKAGIEIGVSDVPYVLDADYSASCDDDSIRIDDGREHIVDLCGHTINRNCDKKQRNGQVFEVTNGSTLTVMDSAGGGVIMGGQADLGGGVYVDKDSEFNLEGGTISGNKGHFLGGAVYVINSTFNLRGGSICDNRSYGSGGGICLYDGAVLNLEGGNITENRADYMGGGVMCASDSKITVKNSPSVKNNYAVIGGNDVFLPGDKQIEVTGPLENASVYVAIGNEQGEFTDNYGAHNPGKDPADHFASTEGYGVYEVYGEAVLGTDNFGETEYEKPFIDRTGQIKTEPGMLSSHNWMSGISGERYLNEINIPGSHDSGMKEAFWSEYDLTMNGASILAFYMATFAKTQTEYIDRQLEEGARQFDIRLNCDKKVPNDLGYYNWKDDGKNLWIGHGTSGAGHFPAIGPDNKFLSFSTVLEWTKDFLRRHPSETVILNLRDETPREGMEGKIASRARKILGDLALETNPSTGEPYLYKEKGSDDYFARYTDMPQLKDCRGKIVIMVQDNVFLDRVGGFSKSSGFLRYDYTYIDRTDFKLDGTEKVREINDNYNDLNPGGNSAALGTDASRREKTLWYWELNCTGESHKWETYAPFPSHTPIDYAEYVNPRVIGEGKVFNPGLAGQYIGWVRLDNFSAEYAETIWKTNYFDGLDYCTVTVDSDLDKTDYPDRSYRVLKGSVIRIPDNIYKQLPKGKYLDHWKESGKQTKWYPGEEYTVTEDVTFSPAWLDAGNVPVSIIWKDGDDHDGLRGDSVSFDVTKGDDGSHSSVSLDASGHWNCILTEDVLDIVPDWDGVEPTKEHPKGSDTADKYRYEMKHEGGSGYVFTFIHTPDDQVRINGSIEWDDDADKDRIRPEMVTVRLLEDGEEKESKEIRESQADHSWTYDFGERPQYRDGRKIEYSIKADDIDGYSLTVDGFGILNTHESSRDTVNVSGCIEWDDAGDELNKRPEYAEVFMYQGEDREKELNVTKDENGLWTFSFGELPASEVGDDIAQKFTFNEVTGYTSKLETVYDKQAGICKFLVTFTIVTDPADKTDPVITEEPESNSLTYNGEEQVLIKRGNCSGGTLMYAGGADETNAPGDDAFSAEPPAAADAGTYYVWYYVKGDLIHKDSSKACITAAIDRRPVIISGVSDTVRCTGKLQKINEVTESGLVNGDTHNVEFEAEGTEVGRYPGTITPKDQVVITNAKNIDVTGDYDITIVNGTLTIEENIEGLLIKGIDKSGYTYTGSKITPQVEIYDNLMQLKEKKDYTIKYSRNTDAGTAMITVTGKGNFSGKATAAFTINAKSISDPEVEVSEIASAVESKRNYTPLPKITYNRKTLKVKKDFNAAYYKDAGCTGDAVIPKEPGVYYAKITGTGNYTGNVVIPFVIGTAGQIPVSRLKVDKIPDMQYSGSSIEPKPVIRDKNTVLSEGEHYSLAYGINTDVGTGTVTVTGKGKYIGTRIVRFNITGIPMSKVSVSGFVSSFDYNGAQRVQTDMTLSANVVKKSAAVPVIYKTAQEYEALPADQKMKVGCIVSYTNNRDAGTAVMTLTGIHQCTGTVKKNFRIVPFDISKDTGDKFTVLLAKTKYPYAKGGTKPVPAVKFAGTELTEGRDYVLAYANNKALSDGTGKKAPVVKVTGKGNFKGKDVSTVFGIETADMGEAGIRIVANDVIYKNRKGNWKPRLNVTDPEGKRLKAGTDYRNLRFTLDAAGKKEVPADAVLSAGTTVYVKAEAAGTAYKGSVSGSYRIVMQDIGKLKASIDPRAYTGKPITIKERNIKWRLGSKPVNDVTFRIDPGSYRNNVDKGRATVTVYGTGNYGGSKTVTFSIGARKW